MQCTGNLSCIPWRKRAAIVWRYPFFSSCVQCFCVSIPLAVRPTLLQQMDIGSLTCAQTWVRAVHMKRGQAQTGLHKSSLGQTDKLSLILPRQGIEPRVFGLEFRLSLTTELCPWSTRSGNMPHSSYCFKGNIGETSVVREGGVHLSQTCLLLRIRCSNY